MKAQVVDLKFHLSALKKKESPCRCCTAQSRCCSSSHSSGTTTSANTTWCSHTLYSTEELLERQRITHFWQKKKKSFFPISSYATFLEWYFNAWKLSESRISFPLSERRGKSFIAELAVSFFRNHKNFLKSNHKHPGQVNMQILL